MRRTLNLLALMLIIIGYPSCTEDNNEIPINIADKTIIVYMIADNNLDYFAEKNIIEMQKGWQNYENTNLIVYIDRADGSRPSHPIILKIKNDSTQQITSPVIKSYSEANSCDPDHMKKVLEDIISLYPSKNYGLILWSHGTSWFPKGTSNTIKSSLLSTRIHEFSNLKLPLTKSFGLDHNDEMEITDLAKALPLKFDFIIFDACFMGSIEVVYELKDKAEYIIGSSSEIISYGFPYESIFPFLISKSYQFSKLCDNYANFYSQKEGVLATGTISVVKTINLPKLANTTTQIFKSAKPLNGIDISHFQQFDLEQSNKMFDLSELIINISNNEILLGAYEQAIRDVVIYKNNTQNIWGKPIKQFSGLSIFIPTDLNKKFIPFYEKTSWYNYSGYNLWDYN